MSDTERLGWRDLAYSAWHRPASTSRFLGLERATQLGMIDLDDVEYCRRCSEPLALIETAFDVGHGLKATTVMRRLARRCQLPAVLALYAKDGADDISGFRVRSVEPAGTRLVPVTPAAFAEGLWRLRQRHSCEPSQ